jgi:hypothetical protein
VAPGDCLFSIRRSAVKRFEVYTEERVARTYIVTADSAAEARAKLEEVS